MLEFKQGPRHVAHWSRRSGQPATGGPVTASTMAATVGDPAVFRSGPEFAAWLGLVPRQNSSGGKARLGRISKRGDGDLRRLLITGAQAVLRWPKAVDANPWLKALLARRPRLVAAVALANKLARIAWAVCATRPSSGPRRHSPRRSGRRELARARSVMVDRSSDAARATWFVHRATKPAILSRPCSRNPSGPAVTQTAPKAGHMTASDTHHHAQPPLQDGGHPHMHERMVTRHRRTRPVMGNRTWARRAKRTLSYAVGGRRGRHPAPAGAGCAGSEIGTNPGG